MKKFTWLLACVLAITSCEFEEVDMGLPASITFPREGGEYVLPLDSYGFGASISELSGEQECEDTYDSIDGYEIIKYKWLTVKYPDIINTDKHQDKDAHRLIIIADRSDAGKARELRIEVNSGTEFCFMKVRQDW